jgi:hypothetical protein
MPSKQGAAGGIGAAAVVEFLSMCPMSRVHGRSGRSRLMSGRSDTSTRWASGKKKRWAPGAPRGGAGRGWKSGTKPLKWHRNLPDHQVFPPRRRSMAGKNGRDLWTLLLAGYHVEKSAYLLPIFPLSFAYLLPIFCLSWPQLLWPK